MEAGVMTFMFLNGSGRALRSEREARVGPWWVPMADVAVWVA